MPRWPSSMPRPRPTGPPPTMTTWVSGVLISLPVGACLKIASIPAHDASSSRHERFCQLLPTTANADFVASGGPRVPAAFETAPDRPGGTIEIAALIDQHPVGRYQIRLLLLCAAVLFIDGFDTQAIGYVAPELAREWRLPRAALGPVFSAGLFGLMIGALI